MLLQIFSPSIRTLVIKQCYPPSSQAASPDIHHLFGHWSSKQSYPSIFSSCFSGYLPSIRTLVIKQSYPPSPPSDASPDIPPERTSNPNPFPENFSVVIV
ncbi:hypothetical protein RRG08_019144 [Elysia crispata]|uniref:Uncharacterized protein n=1 Tax=Elysia crispata TaxID=231223 RepID=A0AAE0ZCH9_9GAST|nr:hypothetical protein RRG08_019144 [Elysia crispata]